MVSVISAISWVFLAHSFKGSQLFREIILQKLYSTLYIAISLRLSYPYIFIAIDKMLYTYAQSNK